jgi:2-polyprenyl-3-methyl-5-hydroxy-6-metoxy-1,4-benzoquinol methylase
MNSPILERLQIIQPNSVLDVGCGCGAFTASLSKYCKHIEAIEPTVDLIERCKTEHARHNINYRVMDALNLCYSNCAFEVVLARGTLHHIAKWQKSISEMIRVAGRYILIEERINDPRSEGKINGIKAQNLFLELQREIDYAHFPYIPPAEIIGLINSKGFQPQWKIIPSTATI